MIAAIVLGIGTFYVREYTEDASLLFDLSDERIAILPGSDVNIKITHPADMVIGEAICRLLAFCGAEVIRDNHLGDWGTQFGMIIYGYKHFVDEQALAARPVAELRTTSCAPSAAARVP